MIGEPYHFLKLTGSNRNSIVLTGLREMTEYQITVQAYNDYGETDYSRILVARTGQSGTRLKSELESNMLACRYSEDLNRFAHPHNLGFPPEETLDPWLPIERPSKTLISLCGCTG